MRAAHGERDKNGKKRGQGEHSLEQPLPTVLASPDYTLIAPTLVQSGYGEREGGEVYAITDIGMRMLQPRELYRAQGFPDSYVIDRGADGRQG